MENKQKLSTNYHPPSITCCCEADILVSFLFLFVRVLYFSIHRYEYGKYWPWLRESDYDYIGEGDGIGCNINVPLNQVGFSLCAKTKYLGESCLEIRTK